MMDPPPPLPPPAINNLINPEIPVEIVSEEEMAFIEAALASAKSLSPSLRSPVRLAGNLRAAPPTPDIEDSAARRRPPPPPPPKRHLLRRFRPRRALSVTDITATEWCEKRMEFTLYRGRPRRTRAMKAGCERHARLEEEVVEKVDVRVHSAEDSWALKLMNFTARANQLMLEGLTRELPVVGVIEGVWMIGIIDELRMPAGANDRSPLLVDTKTRHRPTLASAAQRRNARLQLMCYKSLWDNLVASSFPSEYFFRHFELDPHGVLSDDLRRHAASLGCDAKKLDDVVMHFASTCRLLPPSQRLLLLRYESQSDESVLEECEFPFDAAWTKDRIQKCLEFWRGEREAGFAPEAERWKCRFCSFADVCSPPTPSSVP